MGLKGLFRQIEDPKVERVEQAFRPAVRLFRNVGLSR